MFMIGFFETFEHIFITCVDFLRNTSFEFQPLPPISLFEFFIGSSVVMLAFKALWFLFGIDRGDDND